jgi:iron complex outermembrane receptor protein
MNTSRFGVEGVSEHRHTRLAGALALALAMGVASGAVAANGPDQTAGVAPPATNTKVENAKADKRANVKQHTATLQTVMVTAYVPRATNAAAKMEVPLLETPQSVTVIPRAQMNLLNWQNLDQAVRYTSGVVGGIFGPDPRYDWLNQRGFNPTVYINGLQAPIGSVHSTGIDLFGFQTVEVLKGPSSALYGSAPPGGIVDMTSRRPEGIFNGEVQLQYGSFANKQGAVDVTGPLNAQGTLLGRITALDYSRGTQRFGVGTNRFYIAPALTWLASPDTTLTLLSYFQRDAVDGDGNGFLPSYGVLSPNPLGKVSTSTNLGDTDYNRFKRRQYGVGYEFAHRFNEHWQFKQDMMYFSDITDILQVYGAGLATNADGVPTDYRTVNRFNFPFDENIHALEVDSRLYGKFGSGDVTQNVLVGLAFRRYTDHALFGFAAAPSIDLFDPVYGMSITTPPLSFPYLQQVQKQTGLYAEDVIKVHPWVLTVGGREDALDTDNFGVGTTNHKFSYHVGLNYLLHNGLAPYVSYATSFQPTSGADFAGKAFAPTSGTQTEAGLKFQPASAPPGVHVFATLAAYDLKQNNVLTPDPTHALFQTQTGQVEVKGLELEGVMRVGDHWSFNAALTTMNPKVTRSNGPDLGKQLPVTPRHMASALVDYTQRSGALAGLGASIGFRYIGPSYGDGANTLKAPGAALWDSTIHYSLGDHWLMDLSLSNMFNKTYVAQCSSVAACYYGVKQVVNFTVTRLL